MRAPFFSLSLFLLATVAGTFADSSKTVAAYDAILAGVQPDQTTVAFGDMIVPVAAVRLWRDQLAGTAPPNSASQTGVSKWTGGIVYYAFDASVSAAHRTATLDAMAEWAMFGNIAFTLRVAQPNYILIKDVPGLGGGVAALGMAGGAQQFVIGSNAWNRGTLLHELGHTLGLIHEHQRSNRNTFVTVNFANVPGGAGDGNFILIPTSTNNGLYDFLSVMHYQRKQSAVNPALDTITPNAGYTQFIDLMGNNPDRLLSRGDRDGIALMYSPAPALSTVVTNTKDAGVGSLRAAIYKAFDLVTDTPGTTPTITFQIPNTDPNFAGGVFTIAPTAPLPAPGANTTIDATTQTAFTGNTNASGPEVVLSGALQPAPEFYTTGLRLSAANVTVKGFVISGFSTNGIFLADSATGNTVAGCYIGTNAAGTAAVANGYEGIVFDGSQNNTIGGTGAGARNVISGNTYRGIILSEGAVGNVVAGNFIGVNAAGTAALPNQAGLYVLSPGNTIGGSVAGAGNVISGNTYQGVLISDAGSDANVVAGNFIGLNAAGTAAVANGYAGVEIAGVQDNVIGGTTTAARNVISGNGTQGILLNSGAATKNNVIAGNFIGLNAGGTAAIPNAFAGVEISDGSRLNTVGGTAPGAGNVISGNTSQGILIRNSATMGNKVAGNFIGLNAAGTAAVANGFSGVEIGAAAQFNSVGGTTPGARNVISGNTIQGVYLNGAGTNSNLVSGNYIGTNAAGGAAVPNAGDGVEIWNGPSGNTIGGATIGAGNVISGNANRNVLIIAASSNTVAGNLIGLNAAGTATLVNGGPGIQMWGGATGNTIGGTSGGRNFICGNTGEGMTISDPGTNANIIVGNSIGTTPTGAIVANSGNGISIFGGPQNNVIGGSTVGAANWIAGNNGAGIAIYNASTANRISGNSLTANNGLGIDFWNDGVSANDAGDADTGPNNLQNFPVLNSAVLGTGTTISWTLNSTPNTTFRVEFFANASNDGEGQTFLGAASVSTIASGNPAVTPISTTLPAIVPANHYITATATDAAGNTSEFSAHRQVSTTDSEPDGLPDAYEIATWTNLTSATGAGDSDGDGMTNAQEFRAGTNPRDPLSIFRLAPPATAGADKTLSLANFAGRTYRIDYADILGSPTPWRILADQIPGTGSAITITDPGAASLPQRFYRAVVEP